MFKRKLLLFLTLFLLLFNISAYADNTGSIKVFFINGLNARFYQIGNYDSNGKLIKNQEFEDLETVESGEIKKFLKNHSDIDYKLCQASEGEFILSDIEKGVYYLELVPNSKYEMDGILIEMPLKIEESNTEEWFYEIEPKFEKKQDKSTTISKEIQILPKDNNAEILEIYETEVSNNSTEYSDPIINKQETLFNIKLAKTGDDFSLWVIAVSILSITYIVYYIRRINKNKNLKGVKRSEPK